VREFRDQAAAVRDRSHADSDAWSRRLASMKADAPARADAEAALARSRAQEAAADAATKQVDLVMNGAAQPQDTLGQTVGAVSPLLPEPIRLPLALGAALIASLVRSAQLKQGMASIATGLNKAMEEDEQFKAGFRRHANTFRSIQTPLAKKVVDQTTRRRATRKAA
jgi:hypothetical protein